MTVLLLSAVLSLTIAPFTGLMVDADTKEPLPFTNITVSGKGIGTVSNAEGHFVLDMEGIAPDDTIVFSYVGYETFRISAEKLKGLARIPLHPAPIQLGEVAVLSRQLTAKEILARVRENYEENHPTPPQKQDLFFHRYEKTPWPEQNQMILKNSDFVGLEQGTFDELFRKLPDEFIEYQDALVTMYNAGDEHKIVPVQGISMEEGGMEDLSREMEEKLSVFMEDIEKTNRDEDIYYKFRTGILSMKADSNMETDSLWTLNKNDSLHYHVRTSLVKDNIRLLLKDFTRMKSKNWEFITDPNKYEYALGEVTVFGDELVYTISFTPERRGLFEGTLYISTSSYAILQMDFAFAPGKTSENIQFMGIGHSLNFKKGRVIFERGELGYFVKYVYAEKHETASIERSFSVMKKEKRFLFDKTLNEIRMEARLFFDISSYWELLVLDREAIDASQYERVKQPSLMKFKKEYAYTPDMWNDRTMITPTSELKTFKRK